MSEATKGLGWSLETMQIINELTPTIDGKAFDPDWFLLRQRLEAYESENQRLKAANAELTTERDQARKAILSYGKGEKFDWDVLGRIDELERANAKLLAANGSKDG